MAGRTPQQMRNDALAIWQAGLEAVRSDRLVRENVRVESDRLAISGETIELANIGRILVVGAGKAGAGMAAGLEAALGTRLMADKQLTGWIHVPADCVRPLGRIHLHAARDAGVNEPTPQGVEGSQEMLRKVAALAPDDLCIALVSGGGSALLPLPIDGITLADKLAVTRFLSAAGAPIEELNTVRKQLSQIKGGGLARACGARRMVTLIISDVLGDPLDLIASGPTVDDRSTPALALEILERHGAREAAISERVFTALQSGAARSRAPIRAHVSNHIIGNNAVAVEAAASAARRLGYTVHSQSANASEGAAEEVGRSLAEAAIAMRAAPGPDCLISGGEPTVRLVEAGRRGLGGRNQQLALAALERLSAAGNVPVTLLSGGTDGEDGPTDAAGAWTDPTIVAAASRQKLDPADFLARNDAYHFFAPLGALLKTGPTDTNVCDVRVVLVERAESPRA
jgi:glycerate 2-kinase